MFKKNHELIVMSLVFLFAVFGIFLIFSDVGLTGYVANEPYAPNACLFDPVCREERRKILDIEHYIDECHRENPGGLTDDQLEVCIRDHMTGIAHRRGEQNRCAALRYEDRKECIPRAERYPQGLGKGLVKTYAEK